MKHVLRVVAAFFVSSTAAWSAKAETIFLQCGSMDVMAVDLTNKTVNGKAATTSPMAIDWDNVNDVGDVHLHIDRTAGTLTISGTYYRSDGNVPIPSSTYNCAIVNAPATKF
ncbi:MAG TPA: hypothetical protein VMD53_08445 [Rhizomicrobium sp.]|nr:hypothetical protein [Rhizomicrobium sp.]